MDELKTVLVGFWMKFARMLSVGVPILQTLKVVQEETTHPALKAAVGALRAAIENGKTFSEGLALAPDIFPNSIRTMVRAGEVTGRLESVCMDVARGIEEGSLAAGAAPAAGEAASPAEVEVKSRGVIQTVSMILAQGVRRRASDIHLESVGEKLRVRYRIDGVLHPGAEEFSGDEKTAILSRI